MKRHDNLTAGLLLLLATVLWGLSFPLMKALPMVQRRAVPGADEWFLTFLTLTLRFGATALLLIPFHRRALTKITANEWKLGLGLGLFAGIGILLQMAGLQHTLASTSGFLTQLYVLLIPLSVAIWHRRCPPLLDWISCGLVLAGIAVLCGISWNDLRLGRGEWLTLLGSISFTAQILWLSRREFDGCNKSLATWVQFATIALLFAPPTWWLAASPRDLWAANASPTAIGMLAILGFLCGALAFSLMNHWQPKIQPTHAGLIYSSEPLFVSLYTLFLPGWLGTLGGIDYPNEQLTANLWIGGGLITLANILVQFAPKPETAKS